MKKELLMLVAILITLGFVAAEKAKIKGSISVSERPIRDIDVSLKKMPAGEIVQTQKTDQKGVFFFENIDPGSYQIEIKGVTVNASSDEIKGRISKDKTLRANLEVLLMNDIGQLITTTTSDAKGEFFFSNIDAGNYTIYINTGELSESGF